MHLIFKAKQLVGYVEYAIIFWPVAKFGPLLGKPLYQVLLYPPGLSQGGDLGNATVRPR